MNEDIPLIQESGPKATPESSHKCSYEKSLNNILLANLGISILAMGYGIKVSGIFLSIPVFIFVYSIGLYSALLLDDLARKLNFDSPSIMHFSNIVVGKNATIAISIVLIICAIGPAASYFVYFVELINKNACKHGYPYLCEDKTAIMTIALIVLILLGLISTMKNYSYVSIIGNLFLVIGYGIIFYYAAQHYPSQDYSKINYFDINGFPTIFAISCFSLACNTIVFEVRREIEVLDDFPGLLKVSYLLTGLITYTLPLLFYIGFLDETKPVVLFNLPIEDVLGSTAQILYGFALLFSFPLILYPVYSILGSALFEKSKRLQDEIGNDDENKETDDNFIGVFIMKVTVAFGVFLIAYMFKEILIIVELAGSFSSSSIIFIIPISLFEFHYYKHPDFQRDYNKYFNFTILTFGIVVTIFNTVHTIRNFINK